MSCLCQGEIAGRLFFKNCALAKKGEGSVDQETIGDNFFSISEDSLNSKIKFRQSGY